MKTERRHELQKNELADWMTQYVEILQNYWQVILAGVIGVMALVWLIAYLATPGPKNSKEWRDYLTELAKPATDDEEGTELAAFGRKNHATTPGLWALQLSADRDLAQGLQQQFVDRTKSKDAFTKAAETYVQVVQDTKDPFLLARANFGAAQAYEGSGELAKAIDYYNAAAKHDGERTIGRESKKRLAYLEKKETAEWFDWFFKHKLEPIAPRPTRTPLPPMKMEMLSPFRDLPDFPELDLPDPEDIERPIQSRPILGPVPPPTSSDKKTETPPAAPEPKTDSKATTPAEPKADPKPAGK